MISVFLDPNSSQQCGGIVLDLPSRIAVPVVTCVDREIGMSGAVRSFLSEKLRIISLDLGRGESLNRIAHLIREVNGGYHLLAWPVPGNEGGWASH